MDNLMTEFKNYIPILFGLLLPIIGFAVYRLVLKYSGEEEIEKLDRVKKRIFSKNVAAHIKGVNYTWPLAEIIIYEDILIIRALKIYSYKIENITKMNIVEGVLTCKLFFYVDEIDTDIQVIDNRHSLEYIVNIIKKRKDALEGISP
jgi:hypothetical protein